MVFYPFLLRYDARIDCPGPFDPARLPRALERRRRRGSCGCASRHLSHGYSRLGPDASSHLLESNIGGLLCRTTPELRF